jgi:2'-5' RNA ligase
VDQGFYFIAIMPDEALKVKVNELKEAFKTSYGAQHALKTPAHITLQKPFRQVVKLEQKMTEQLAAFASQQKPFRVELKGYGSFSPRVIYIAVNNPDPVLNLHAGLKDLLIKQLNFEVNEVSQQLNPHMTLAHRDLSASMFHKAWNEFKDHTFDATFEVQSLYLLKHNGKNWDVFKEFPFCQ